MQSMMLAAREKHCKLSLQSDMRRACRLDAEELNRALREELQETSQAADAASQAAAAEQIMLREKLQLTEAELAGTCAKLAAAREESERKMREHWESTR